MRHDDRPRRLHSRRRLGSVCLLEPQSGRIERQLTRPSATRREDQVHPEKVPRRAGAKCTVLARKQGDVEGVRRQAIADGRVTGGHDIADGEANQRQAQDPPPRSCPYPWVIPFSPCAAASRARCASICSSARAHHPLHGRAMRRHLAALQIGLGHRSHAGQASARAPHFAKSSASSSRLSSYPNRRLQVSSRPSRCRVARMIPAWVTASQPFAAR